MSTVRLGMRLGVAAGALALVGPLLTGCGALTSANGSSKPSVVTSFYPLAYVARRIVGDHMQVSDLRTPDKSRTTSR